AQEWTARDENVLSTKMEGEIMATANIVRERRFHWQTAMPIPPPRRDSRKMNLNRLSVSGNRATTKREARYEKTVRQSETI
ncbi:MAG: hypothetical protein J6S67_22045, partial [Methanobrevibacter sp.]|nr:hypothetical protein [Methanobrevibacter sp.]